MAAATIARLRLMANTLMDWTSANMAMSIRRAASNALTGSLSVVSKNERGNCISMRSAACREMHVGGRFPAYRRKAKSKQGSLMSDLMKMNYETFDNNINTVVLESRIIRTRP